MEDMYFDSIQYPGNQARVVAEALNWRTATSLHCNNLSFPHILELFRCMALQ